MDNRTKLLLEKLPLPPRITLKDAADILGGPHWLPYLVREVAGGHLFSWSHSPERGAPWIHNNVTLNYVEELPRISQNTPATTVFVKGSDILWRWCVEYEESTQGTNDPSKESVEARLKLVVRLAQDGAGSSSAAQQNTGEIPRPVERPASARRLKLVGNNPINFGDLSDLMADALWPDIGPDDDRMEYGVARLNLDEELKAAVHDGLLKVRDPATLGRTSFVHGGALMRSVILPVEDLLPYLLARGGIEVHLVPQQDRSSADYATAGESPDREPIRSVSQAGATVWTEERKQQAKAMLDQLRGQGVKAYAAATAKAFHVSTARLREVLKDESKPVRQKTNNSAFNWNGASKKGK